MASFALRGDKEMARRLQRLASDFPDDAGKALHTEGEQVLEKSQAIVPVLTGALKATGKVSEPEKQGKEIQVAISYGDENVRYAAAVHELAGSDGKGHKYLENPLRGSLRGMARRIATRISEVMK